MAFGGVVTEELDTMPAAPFAEVVVALVCFCCEGIGVAMIVHSDDFLHPLLQVDEYLRNKFWINLVSLAGPGHEKGMKFLKRVITCGTDGCWTWMGHPTHSKKLVNDLNLGGAKGAATPRSKATGVNDPHSEDKWTPGENREIQVTRGKVALSLCGTTNRVQGSGLCFLFFFFDYFSVFFFFLKFSPFFKLVFLFVFISFFLLAVFFLKKFFTVGGRSKVTCVAVGRNPDRPTKVFEFVKLILRPLKVAIKRRRRQTQEKQTAKRRKE